jgi:hypothetical protein
MRSVSPASAVIHVHIVTSALGKPSAARPQARSCCESESLAARKASGVVLLADANQPSPSRATRRSPGSEPELPIQTGTPPLRRGAGASCEVRQRIVETVLGWRLAAQQRAQDGSRFLEPFPALLVGHTDCVIVAL